MTILHGIDDDKLSMEEFIDLKTHLLLMTAYCEQSRMSLSTWLNKEHEAQHWNLPPKVTSMVLKSVRMVKLLAPHADATQMKALLEDDHEYIRYAAKVTFTELKK